jgi:radical SAM superfamily enzyme YgiQ (UPF0313 family)
MSYQPKTAGIGGLRREGAVLLVSCYELGHQPMGLAMPAAFLQRARYEPVLLDTSVEPAKSEHFARASVVAISTPMHTALRLGIQVARMAKRVNPSIVVVFTGLYAELNADYLLEDLATYCLGPESEASLVALLDDLDAGRKPVVPGLLGPGRARPQSPVALTRLRYPVPERRTLSGLHRYANVVHDGVTRLAGYTETTRGCLHQCRHCPIPAVYGGRFFAVPAEVVLADIHQQVAIGATHITFGDPDFLNGPTHALRVIRAMHKELPELTFDFTAKVEHLLRHVELLDEFRDCGCSFIVTAVESLEDEVLSILDKGHSRADVERLVEVAQEKQIHLRPTWVPFTPWTTRGGYLQMLEFIVERGLATSIDPVQYSIRLLVPPRSLLARHVQMQPHLGPLDREGLTYTWRHPDPEMDDLQRRVTEIVEHHAKAGSDEFDVIGEILNELGMRIARPSSGPVARPPRLTEPWFC